MKNQLTKETEEQLRYELESMIIRTNKKEEQQDLQNFTEYLDKIRNDKKHHFNDNRKTIVEQVEDELHHPVFDSDSPITMGSSEEKEEEEEEEDEEEEFTAENSLQQTKYRKFKKLTYKEVERSLDFNENEENRCLNELDILITFLKGQTHLYSLSQYLTQQKINWLTIPSFVFSIAVTVIAPLIHEYVWSGILISALTASIAALSACVQYYQLDAASTTYLYLTNQYNKMQVSLETVSNSLVIGTGRLRGVIEWKEVIEKIKDVEQKMTELKDSNSILPPEEVKLLIPIISHINIFSFIKKMKIMKKNKISKYRDIKNEIRFILNQWDIYSNEFSESFYNYEPIDTSHSSQSSSKTATAAEGVPGNDFTESSNWKKSKGGKKEEYYQQHPWKKKRHQMLREKHRMSCLIKKKSEIRKELNYYHTAYSYIDEIFTREINLADHTSHWLVLVRWFLGIQPNCLPRNNPVVDKYLEFIFIQPQRYSVEVKQPRRSFELVAEHSVPKKIDDYYSDDDMDMV